MAAMDGWRKLKEEGLLCDVLPSEDDGGKGPPCSSAQQLYALVKVADDGTLVVCTEEEAHQLELAIHVTDDTGSIVSGVKVEDFGNMVAERKSSEEGIVATVSANDEKANGGRKAQNDEMKGDMEGERRKLLTHAQVLDSLLQQVEVCRRRLLEGRGGEGQLALLAGSTAEVGRKRERSRDRGVWGSERERRRELKWGDELGIQLLKSINGLPEDSEKSLLPLSASRCINNLGSLRARHAVIGGEVMTWWGKMGSRRGRGGEARETIGRGGGPAEGGMMRGAEATEAEPERLKGRVGEGEEREKVGRERGGGAGAEREGEGKERGESMEPCEGWEGRWVGEADEGGVSRGVDQGDERVGAKREDEGREEEGGRGEEDFAHEERHQGLEVVTKEDTLWACESRGESGKSLSLLGEDGERSEGVRKGAMTSPGTGRETIVRGKEENEEEGGRQKTAAIMELENHFVHSKEHHRFGEVQSGTATWYKQNGRSFPRKSRAVKLVKMAQRAARARREKGLGASPGAKRLNGTEHRITCHAVSPARDRTLSRRGRELSRSSSEEREEEELTASGSLRRKHHRSWTLGEVVTLIEGVAQCGGGKWAEIKKLGFSSIGYRTAVDLKDKWRNLLRASRLSAQRTGKGSSAKKHKTAFSIPDRVLARVRELADQQEEGATNGNEGTERNGGVKRTSSRSGRPLRRLKWDGTERTERITEN